MSYGHLLYIPNDKIFECLYLHCKLHAHTTPNIGTLHKTGYKNFERIE